MTNPVERITKLRERLAAAKSGASTALPESRDERLLSAIQADHAGEDGPEGYGGRLESGMVMLEVWRRMGTNERDIHAGPPTQYTLLRAMTAAERLRRYGEMAMNSWFLARGPEGRGVEHHLLAKGRRVSLEDSPMCLLERTVRKHLVRDTPAMREKYGDPE